MWSLADASPDRLRELARNIDNSGRWISFLTPQEYQLFAVALNHSLDTWSRFLQGKIPCQLRFPGSDDGVVVTEMDPVTLAFRVRYMLWESQIGDLHEPTKPGTGDEPPREPERGPSTRRASDSEAAPAADGNDNDYDEDYDDEDSPKEPSQDDESETRLEVLVVDTKQEDSEPDPRGRIGAVQNSSKMYDTFDQDVEKMKRFQRLKDSDEQIGEDGNDADPSLSSGFSNYGTGSAGSAGTGSGSGLQAFAKTAQFGSANLCLKHLLTTIESKRSELHVTDIELRNLISDVRKNRSKWASEERIGQEELYEACERVVQELRGTTEHSTAFLNKVSKREAPNYYDVIKHPMDLNTVMRKLRALQYNSKKQFVNDLDLIWTNCLTYNSDPSHFLRVHAIAMRKKTQALIPLIPDVAIRSRAEVEAEAEELEKQAKEQRKRRGSDSDSGGHGSKRKVGVAPAEPMATRGLSLDNSSGTRSIETNQGSTAQSSRSGSEEASEESARNSSAERDASEAMDVVDTPSNATEHAETQAGKTTNNSDNNENVAAADTTPGPNANGEELAGNDETADDGDGQPTSGYLIEEEEYKVPDVESAFWSSATRRRRIQCISGRQMIFAGGKLQMDAPISVRTPGSMARFDKAIRGEDIAGQMSSLSLLSTDPGEEPFMIEYETSAGMPPSPTNDNSPWITAAVPKLQELSRSNYLSYGVLSDLVNRNLNEMQMIRRLCAKILYIKDLQSGQLAAPSASDVESMGTGAAGANSGVLGGSALEFPSIEDPEPDISSRLPGAVPYDKNAAYSSIRRSAAKVAMHAGFEAAQPRAADILASVAGDYLTKLGAMIVANLEAPGSTASFNSILLNSLDCMGVSQPNQLTKYISRDVLKQGRRLSTFRSRLNTMLVDILRPEVERYQDEQFNDNSEQFVLGQFSNELGDDYFGFKELGINKELGVASIAIPFHLLQQRVVDQDTGTSKDGIHRKLGLTVPEYPPLTTDDVEQLPAFLKPAFESMLLKHKRAGPEPAPEANTGTGSEEGQGASENTGDPNKEHIASLAAQAAASRAKVPASGKLAPRKKRIDRAFIVKFAPQPKQEEEEEEQPAEGSTENKEPPHSEPSSAAYGQASTEPSQDVQDVDSVDRGISDADADADVELGNIGSLAFGADDTPSSTNGFVFYDNVPTGSLMLQGDEDEDNAAPDNDDLGFSFMKK